MGTNSEDDAIEIKSLDDDAEKAGGPRPVVPTDDMKVEPSLPRPRPSVPQ